MSYDTIVCQGYMDLVTNIITSYTECQHRYTSILAKKCPSIASLRRRLWPQ